MESLDDNKIKENGGRYVKPEITKLEPLAVDCSGAASLLSISRSHFLSLLSAGRIGPQGERLGRRVVFPVDELRRWVLRGMPPRCRWMQEKDL